LEHFEERHGTISLVAILQKNKGGRRREAIRHCVNIQGLGKSMVM
jgi:hypothetical protein